MRETHIVITPKKTKVNIGDSVDVDIEMIDCDGIPLGNREIFFTDQEIDGNTFSGTTGGTVNPPSVTTDASGKAKVKFKAGSTTGLGQIAAIYPHTKPCGRHDAFLGNAVVVIGQPAKTLWQVSAAIHEKVDRRIDTTWTSGSGTGSHLLTDTYEGMAFIDALVENGGVDTSSFYFVCYEESGDTFENATVCGNWNEDYFKRYCIDGGVLPPAVDIQVKHYSGPVFLGSGYTGFEFHYPNKPTDVAIVAQCAGIAEGSSFSKFTSNNPEYHWEESSNDNPTESHIFTEFNANECSITKSGTRYTITGSRTRVTTSGEEETTRTVDIFATISLFDSSTGVRQVDAYHSSSKNVLWNCPNSLSPNTRIEFALVKKSKVAIDIIDIFGRKVVSLANGERCAGVVYAEIFDASKISTGIYFCRLQAANSVLVKKINVLK